MSEFEFSITDLGTIAYLRAKGHMHVALKPTGRSGQLAFLFRGPEIQNEINNYFSGALVPACAFWEQAKLVKSILYGAKECYHGDHAAYVAKQGGAK